MADPLPTLPGPDRRPTASDWSRVRAPGPEPASSFSVGYLLARSFSTWARHAVLFAALGALGNVPMAVTTYRLYARMPVLPAGDPARAQEFLSEFPTLMGSFLLGILASMVAMSLLMAAICQGAAQALRGERVRLGAMAAAAVHRAPYVLAVVLLATLAVLATACTLAVPVLLMVGWCASVPATVLEGTGPIRSLARSWDLTRGYRWQLFAGFAVLTVCLVAAGGVAQGVSTAAILAVSGPQAIEPGPAMALPTAIYQVLAGMLGTLGTVGVAVAHHGLRAAKEGGDPAALAQVFE